VEKKDSRKQPDIEPLRLRIGAKQISVGPPDKPTFLTLPELISHLTDYVDATRATGVDPRIALLTNASTSDTLFRQALGTLNYHSVRSVAILEHRK
jgi:hypothetical protein